MCVSMCVSMRACVCSVYYQDTGVLVSGRMQLRSSGLRTRGLISRVALTPMTGLALEGHTETHMIGQAHASLL